MSYRVDKSEATGYAQARARTRELRAFGDMHEALVPRRVRLDDLRSQA